MFRINLNSLRGRAMEKRLKKVIIIISVLFFLCFTSCGGHKPQEPSIDLSTLYHITDFGPTFRLKDENGTEYVSEEIDTDMLFGQMPDNKVEVGDIYAYMLVEGWKIAYVARVEGCDKNSLISGFEDGSGTISEKNFQAFWVIAD